MPSSLRPCPGCDADDPSGRGGVVLRECRGCGTLYTPETPSADELRAYYNSEYQVVAEAMTAMQRSRWSALLDLVDSSMSPGRVVEIGSSAGHFLRLLEERGWEPAGVEIDDRARAAHLASSPSLPAFADVDAAAAAGWTQLDLVVALHTIEHYADPTRLLAGARALLRPGGMLLLTTPNAASVVRHLARNYWEWWTPPAHLELFTPRGLALAVSREQFEVVRVLSRRGDANGTTSNVVLAPLRGLKRALRGRGRQTLTARSSGHRISNLIDRVGDPLTALFRQRAYDRLRGPELIMIARSTAGEASE